MQPGQELVQEVRAGFIKQGTSLSAYCRQNGIEGKTVHRLLSGKWDGKKAREIRAQLIEAANVKTYQDS